MALFRAPLPTFVDPFLDDAGLVEQAFYSLKKGSAQRWARALRLRSMTLTANLPGPSAGEQSVLCALYHAAAGPRKMGGIVRLHIVKDEFGMYGDA